MADQRDGGIIWTEETWNPLRGCSPVSEGCRNCYAARMAARFCKPGEPYEGLISPGGGWNNHVKLVPEVLEKPLHWKRPRMIFVNSMSDLFHEAVPDEFIREVFNVMVQASAINHNGHTFQVLTKRPHRMMYFARRYTDSMSNPILPYCPRIWLGVSAENQKAADERIPLLVQTPAAVRFVSCEPMLGPVDLQYSAFNGTDSIKSLEGLHWVIVGGESGPGARPMHPDWARGLRNQCQAAGVPFLFKQWGEWVPPMDGAVNEEITDGGLGKESHRRCMFKVGKKSAGRLMDGRTWDEFPKVERVEGMR